MSSLVIINPNSAHGRTRKNWKAWEERLKEAIGPFETAWTRARGDGETLTRAALSRGVAHIHALGGDGTAHEVINGFFDGAKSIAPEATLSLWPAGSGCDFWRYLDRVKMTSERQIIPIDLGRAHYMNHAGLSESRYFLNVASCGISGVIDQIMDQRGRLKLWGGPLAYMLATLEGLLVYENKRVAIKSSAGDWGYLPLRCAAFANGRYFGAGMKIAPAAEIDDGTLDLVVLGDIGRFDAIAHTPQLYRGTHLSHSKIRHGKITEAYLQSEERVLVDLDGEAVGTLPLRIEIIPRALSLLLFPRASAL